MGTGVGGEAGRAEDASSETAEYENISSAGSGADCTAREKNLSIFLSVLTVAGRRDSFSFPASIAVHILHGACPPNVFAKASASGESFEYSMTIPVQATDWRTAQCPPAIENIAANNSGNPKVRIMPGFLKEIGCDVKRRTRPDRNAFFGNERAPENKPGWFLLQIFRFVGNSYAWNASPHSTPGGGGSFPSRMSL